ncbi:kinase-like domain-containing protein, partial [Mycena rebaudengoi]
DSAITWLLEPLRSAAMDRWSGTLLHPNHSNKAGLTMDAFMHFSFVYSQSTLVFSNLQSTKGRCVSGSSGSILFDVMTHSNNQDGGVGDHGPAGITAIFSEHICGRVCLGLDMGDV